MHDMTDDDRARVEEIARVGHSVTDRDADFLRSLVRSAPAPVEFPKMVYPDENARHGDEAPVHLRGTPKGVVVASADEEREVMGARESEPPAPLESPAEPL